jgi:hypothetical protein
MHGRTGILGAISSLAAVAAAAALAAGPAGAATAASGTTAARTTAASTTTAARPAAGRPLRGWAATVLAGTASAAKGGLAITPQARTATASSNVFSGAALYGVSCTGRKQCTATGSASTRNRKNYKPLAERWNGTTWAKQTTPIPSSGGLVGGTLTAGVSCTSSSACMAAGYAYSAKTVRLLGEGWNGRTWSIQPDSTPATQGYADRISCTWAKDCMAVGFRAHDATLAEHWNGRHWSAETTRHTGELDGVSCRATGNCTAVGWNLVGKALAAHWNGKAWSDESPVDPQPLTFLQSVACPATTACIAVGAGNTGSSTADALTPLAEQWTGGTWTALTVPDPGPSGDIVELNSVSCISATNCMAVGDGQNAAGTADTTLAAQWNGTTWTSVATPSPATLSALFSVSCTSATFCSAVGASSPTATGVVSPVAETWNGSTWSLQAAAG